MSLIKIRQLEERIATSGLFMGNTENVTDGAFRRKLQPGEIVEIPDDLETDDGKNLMKMLWDTGAIDIVPDDVPPTRPLDYRNRREAMVCAPNYKPNGPDEERQMNTIRAEVDARLFESSESQPDEAESPEEDTPEETVPESPPIAAASLPAAQKRARRGAQPKVTDHGAQATT